MPSTLSAPLSLSELNDSLWLVLLRWLRFGDGLLSPDSSLSDTEESLLDFRLDLPVLPSLSASSSCLCLASHHICCRWTTSGYLACKYNKRQLGSMFNYIPWSINLTVIKNFIFQYEVAVVVGVTCNIWCKQPRWSRGSVLAFGTLVHGFASGRSRRIFRAKKSSARLRSEGK